MLGPQLALTAGLVGALGVGMSSRPPRLLLRLLGTTALLAAIGLALFNESGPSGPLIRLDAFGLIAELLACLGALPLILLHEEDDEVPVVLALGSVLGMTLLAAGDSLVMLFIGLEFMSLPAYLLVARGSKPAALEAGVKYFFAGSVAGALFLFGMALHYAGSGSLALAAAGGPLAEGGLVLMGCAALFKLGAVPLHFWLPDVYEACEPEVAAFFSTSMKAAAALLLIRLAALAPASAFAQALPWVGGATVLFGALLALRQQSLQRLLAYSSISHAGFLILGVGAWAALGADRLGARAVFFYLGVYLFMSSGVFLWLKVSGIGTRSALKGYARGRSWSAAALAALLVSLAGIPPTGGFLAKLLVFWDAVKAGLYGPAALAGLGSLVSIAYYLGLIQDLYADEASAAPQTAPGGLLVGLCAACAVLLGLAPAAPLLLEALR
jgi:NADH-quinone oxidoreductase subunit N